MKKKEKYLKEAVKALVINGLGFANHPLYLMPEFFADKLVERLIGIGITAENLNQNLFGRRLDVIHKFGVTPFFTILSNHTVKQLELPCLGTHIDSSTLDGKYNIDQEAKEAVIKITKGYS